MVEIKVGDRAYIREIRRSSTQGPWENDPYKVDNNQITGERHGDTKVRDRSDWKVVKKRPAHLNLEGEQEEEQEPVMDPHFIEFDHNPYNAPAHNPPCYFMEVLATFIDPTSFLGFWKVHHQV